MNQSKEFLKQLPNSSGNEILAGEIRPLAWQWIYIKWAINRAARHSRSWPHSSGVTPEWVQNK